MKPIPGFPKYLAHESGEIFSQKRNRWLKDFVGAHGYKYVNLVLPNGQIKHIGVHRLILLAFHGQPPEGTECRHLNGCRTDNRLENLCWGTRYENAQDRFRHGTRKRKQPKPVIGCKGEHNGHSKLTEDNVLGIRQFFRDGLASRESLAEAFNVTPTCIDKIIRRQRWNHI